jgi:hypothetical protein
MQSKLKIGKQQTPLKVHKNQKFYKINITEDANTKLETMLTNLTNNNSTIKINKQKLISWIIIQFENKYFLKSKEQIEKEHFDQLGQLQTVLKLLKESEGNPTDELKDYLRTIIKGTPLQNQKLENPEVR